jgi:hypothetical protein
MTKREQMGHEIVAFEGRFDKDGKLLVYKLPAGDGGGNYEIAGINERYHPSKSKQLKDLIESGQHSRAKTEAADYIIAYTDPVLKFFPSPEYAESSPHIEFLLRDTAFNRGVKGAATVLQLALGIPTDGIVGEKTKAAFKARLDVDKVALARSITKARETYERTSYPWKTGKRDESSKFWGGLASRWDKAHTSGSRLV